MPYLKKAQLVAITFVLALTCSLISTIPVAAQGQRLIKQYVTVPPGKWVSQKFTVFRQGAKVEGKFRAEGGFGNDIQALILDEDAYENFSNGHSVKTYFNSNKVTVGRISITLSEGVYYLVFTNAFSLASNKVVTSDIYIESLGNQQSDESSDPEFKYDAGHTKLLGMTNLLNADDKRAYGSKRSIATGKIVKVLYDGRIIKGFQMELPDGRRQEIEFDPYNFSNADRSWLYTLIAVNKQIRVSYIAVGSGGFWMADEISAVGSTSKLRPRN